METPKKIFAGIIVFLMLAMFLRMSVPVPQAAAVQDGKLEELKYRYEQQDKNEIAAKEEKERIICESIAYRIQECTKDRASPLCEEARIMIIDFPDVHEYYYEDLCLMGKDLSGQGGARGEVY